MEKNVYDFILGIFHEVNWQLSELQKYSSEDFLPVNKLFTQYHGQSKNIHDKLSTTSPDELVYIEIISKIIKDLQYHDIIRQKIEHIETINKILIMEITCKKDNIPYQFKYIHFARKINELNVAQLKMINYEYQKIINDLKINLNKMEDYISSVSSVFINLSNHFTQTKMFDDLTIIIIEKTKMISERSQEIICHNGSNMEDVIKNLNNIYTMQSERTILSEVFRSEVNSETENKYSKEIKEGDIELF